MSVESLEKYINTILICLVGKCALKVFVWPFINVLLMLLLTIEMYFCLKQK